MQTLRQAMSAHQAGRLMEAEGLYRRALDAGPRQSPILVMLGVVLAQRGRFEEAERVLHDAVNLNPNDARAQFGYGNVLLGLQRLDDAFTAFGKALALDSSVVEAHLNRGSILLSQRRFDEAIQCFDDAIRINPKYAEAHCNRGNALQELKRFDEALASYETAVAINPKNAEFHASHANALHQLKRYSDAMKAISAALVIEPSNPAFHYNLGNVLFELDRFLEAFESYDRAFRFDPKFEYAEGNRLFAKRMICLWDNLTSENTRLLTGVDEDRHVSRPFAFLSAESSPRLQMRCANLCVNHEFPMVQPLLTKERHQHKRIRLGYVSADFREHATAYLIAGLVEGHRRDNFEVIGLSLRPEESSQTGQRLKRAFEKFFDVSSMTDKKITQLVRELEVDILVDLMGFTKNSRMNIFSRRPAPIQVNYLGFPGTTGAAYMDYIIADQIVIPDHQREFYSEKIVYMPNSFQANDQERMFPAKSLTRSELNLPGEDFVFCCFNNSYKITPDVFDSWMRILGRVNDSVLWLVANDGAVENNLRKEAAARNVSAERLVFAPRVPYPEHLARLSAANLFLDTTPFNAGASASDALWAELPVLTRVGDVFAGRMAASLLNAVGLPELITATPRAYEDLAVELATNRKKFAMLKDKLARNRLSEPLFDTRRFTRDIESAYAAMDQRYQAGLQPDHIYVPRQK